MLFANSSSLVVNPALGETVLSATLTTDTAVFYVDAAPAGGFTVTERNKGTSGGTFSCRVVAKRADITGERLARFEMPKINRPDPDKLPKPEPPKKP